MFLYIYYRKFDFELIKIKDKHSYSNDINNINEIEITNTQILVKSYQNGKILRIQIQLNLPFNKSYISHKK